MLTRSSLDDFYRQAAVSPPEGTAKEIGHFNVFETAALFAKASEERVMPYSRRDYYKISWIHGKSRAEYADKVIDIAEDALLFATPRIPYHWVPETMLQTGMFCIFTTDFLAPMVLEELPLFQPGQAPVFELSVQERGEVEYIFRKMLRELDSDYKYKYDLLRNLVQELIHYGQKLQPMSVVEQPHNAAQRISTMFIELLERQFPLDNPLQRLSLRTPADYAGRLSVHVNHLNKVLKEIVGKTTTELITLRVIQEAKVLLKQTNWPVADVAYTLGFDDLAHFSNYFKKQVGMGPTGFRA